MLPIDFNGGLLLCVSGEFVVLDVLRSFEDVEPYVDTDSSIRERGIESLTNDILIAVYEV